MQTGLQTHSDRRLHIRLPAGITDPTQHPGGENGDAHRYKARLPATEEERRVDAGLEIADLRPYPGW